MAIVLLASMGLLGLAALIFIIGPIIWCALLNWQERKFTRIERIEENK